LGGKKKKIKIKMGVFWGKFFFFLKILPAFYLKLGAIEKQMILEVFTYTPSGRIRFFGFNAEGFGSSYFVSR